MLDWWLNPVSWVVLALLVIAGFFFTFTRGALLMRGVRKGPVSDAAHVYPIYAQMWLIKLIDCQPVISAILLFQYQRLVSAITRRLLETSLAGKDLLITSCAFGNVMPRVVEAAVASGVRQVRIVDIIENELLHAKSKLGAYMGQLEFHQDDATALKLADASVDANVIFFLLHELPHLQKIDVLREAGRVLAPGGKLYLAEFHRPDFWIFRAFSWVYFKVFEPLGLSLWDTQDPFKLLEQQGDFRCERQTVFFGNFQVIVATKLA
jgi:ubiquinone/menaquinone biosynthesis C-methylase UbiE